MPELLPYLLCYLALGLAGISAVYLLAIGCNALPFKQSLTPTTPALKQELFDHGQENEFRALTALGFKPLGLIRQSLGGTGNSNEFVFSHSTFPVVGVLTQTQSNQLATSMFSDDALGRFIITTNYDYVGSDHDNRELFLQVDPIAKPDEILKAHISALEIWEEDGFNPVSISTLNERSVQSKRFLEHPIFQKKLLEICIFAPLGIPFIHLGIAFIVGVVWYGLKSTSFEVPIQVAHASFGCLSVLFSCNFLYKLFKHPKRTKGKPPTAQRITHRFTVPTDSIGVAQREFHNRAWEKPIAKRIMKHRWALVVIAVLIWFLSSPFVMFTILLILLLTSRLNRMLPLKYVVSFNDTFLTLERHSVFGSSNLISRHTGLEKLYFKDIDYLKLEPKADGSVKLIAEYAYDPPPTVDEAFGLKLSEKRKLTSGLLIADSSWGFEREAVQQLSSLLREKWHACLATNEPREDVLVTS